MWGEEKHGVRYRRRRVLAPRIVICIAPVELPCSPRPSTQHPAPSGQNQMSRSPNFSGLLQGPRDYRQTNNISICYRWRPRGRHVTWKWRPRISVARRACSPCGHTAMCDRRKAGGGCDGATSSVDSSAPHHLSSSSVCTHQIQNLAATLTPQVCPASHEEPQEVRRRQGAPRAQVEAGLGLGRRRQRPGGHHARAAPPRRRARARPGMPPAPGWPVAPGVRERREQRRLRVG